MDTQENRPLTLEEKLDFAKDKIVSMEATLTRVLAEPNIFAYVVEVRDGCDNPGIFCQGDLITVTDPSLETFGKSGRIIDPPDSEGYVHVHITGGDFLNAAVGLDGKDPAQIKLVGKDDGRAIVIQLKDDLVQVRAVPGLKLEEGMCVRLNPETKQIIAVSQTQPAGDLARFKNRLDDRTLMVEIEGKSRKVFAGKFKDQTFDVGDQFLLDVSNRVVIEVLPNSGEELWHVDENINVQWNDIGGCHDAKKQLIEAVELPLQYPELFAHYHKKRIKGICLSGPPGCGKTMVGKALATRVAEIFGKEKVKTGFRLVNGPELLNKYVGNTEANIRDLFAQGEKHFAKYGFPAIIAIDEAESLLARRGSGVSSDMDKTVVPTFLSQMDGINPMNSIVLLMTNRPDLMDAAILRDGRVDRHIKVPRPDENVIPDILKIYLKDMPLIGTDIDTAIAMVTAELLSPKRTLLNITTPGRTLPPFTLMDCVNGAMLSGLIDKASSLALARDLKEKKATGITSQDLRQAIDWIYKQNRDVNHDLNVLDFGDRHSVPFNALTVEKSFAH